MVFEVLNKDVRAIMLKMSHGSWKDPSVEARVTKLEVVIAEVQGLVEDVSNGIEGLREQV